MDIQAVFPQDRTIWRTNQKLCQQEVWPQTLPLLAPNRSHFHSFVYFYLFQKDTPQGTLMTDLPVAIKKVDMTKKMQTYVIRAAKVAFEKCTSQEEIAAYLKNRFNRRYEPMWTCIVGTNFGAYVSYESRRWVYFCNLSKATSMKRKAPFCI